MNRSYSSPSRLQLSVPTAPHLHWSRKACTNWEVSCPNNVNLPVINIL